MKRIHDMFDEVVSVKTLVAAHNKLKKKGKKARRKAMRFERRFCGNILDLHFALKSGAWRMHEYKHIVRSDTGKRREIDYSPDWGDMVVQCAMGLTIGARLLRSLINDTFAGIPGRGVRQAIRRMYRKIRSVPVSSPLYVYKIDMRKFYQSIDHEKLKEAVRRKVKDKRLVDLLDVLVDSYPDTVGIPIGNLMSPILSNFYLNPLDREAKNRGLMYYRYNDDIVVMSTSKDALRDFKTAAHRIAEDLKLDIKSNEQIFPIERFGIDVMGYVVQRRRILIRRRTERRFRRNARRFRINPTAHGLKSLDSQWGWLKVSRCGRSLFRKEVGFSSAEELNSNYKELLKHG